MAASTIQQPTTAPPPATSQRISWEEVEKTYLTREDGYKYEWLDGIVEKTPRAMNKTQLYIQNNLNMLFYRLLFQGKVTGGLVAEGDLFFLKNHRRPDLSWLTDRQLNNLIDKKAYEVPAFVIEIISGNDVYEKVEDKMEDYVAAKVQVVWQIFPKQKKVNVYTGNSLNIMQVFRGEEICSAAPVLPDFAVPVQDIFKKAIVSEKS